MTLFMSIRSAELWTTDSVLGAIGLGVGLVGLGIWLVTRS